MEKWGGLVIKISLAGLILCFSGLSFSKQLNIIGPVYPIQEVDLLEWIKERLATLQQLGAIEELQKELQQKTINKVNRPKSVVGLIKANHDRVFYVDPTYRLSHDLVDHEGHVFQKAGTTINPLAIMPLKNVLLFFDSDDKKQVGWAEAMDKKYQGKDKLILINGSPAEQIRFWKRPVYFDQGGLLVKKLAIEQVPALVKQGGLKLQVNEFKLSE